MVVIAKAYVRDVDVQSCRLYRSEIDGCDCGVTRDSVRAKVTPPGQ